MKRLIIRLLIFNALIVGLYVCGGFEPPPTNPNDFRASRRRAAAWFPSVALYVAGAAVAVWGDKKIGIRYPTSSRFIYVLAGTVAMAAGLVWSQTVKRTVKMRQQTSVLHAILQIATEAESQTAVKSQQYYGVYTRSRKGR